jgi:hypothetical protein
LSPAFLPGDVVTGVIHVIKRWRRELTPVTYCHNVRLNEQAAMQNRAARRTLSRDRIGGFGRDRF